MPLSEADRAALRARADGLLQEVSSLKAEATSAVDEASQALQDKALVDEVARLEAEKDAALATRDAARGTVEDATAAMLAAAMAEQGVVSGTFVEAGSTDSKNTEGEGA